MLKKTMLIKPFPKIKNIVPVAISFVGFPALITANVYMVGNGPITLIDTGPKIPGALEYIEDQIKVKGFNMEDVERIIITHGHVDHFGLAASIQRICKSPIRGCSIIQV